MGKISSSLRAANSTPVDPGKPPALWLDDDLAFVPSEAAAQRMAWLGTSGSGKSYGCGRYVEQLHAAHVPVVVVDTVGIWPALRLAADGKSPGLPFVIIGGEHADVPLDLAGGKKLALFLVSENASAVVDVSDYPPDVRAPFLADLCEAVLIAVKTHRRPRVFVFDEAQDVAPEKPAKGESRMRSAVTALIRKGRNHLCGTVLLSQRPQDVSKAALNQVGNLFVGALFGKHERDAVRDWAGAKARSTVVDAQLKELPGLQPGQFFFWSPQWMQKYQRIQVLPKWTYDGSSSTPLTNSAKLDELAPVDVQALRALLRPDPEPEPVVPTGPVNRRAAGKQGLASAAVREPADPSDSSHVEIMALREQLKELDIALMLARQELIDERHKARSLIDALHTAIDRYGAPDAEPELVEPRVQSLTPPIVIDLTRPPVVDASKPPRLVPASGELDKPARSILSVLAWQKGAIPRARLALLSGYSVNGGAFKNALSRSRVAGHLDGSTSIGITEAGRSAIGTVERPPTGARLFSWWLRHPKIDKPMRAILETLRNADGVLPSDVLRERGGFQPGAGNYKNALSRLRVLGLVYGKGKEPIALAADLRAK